MNEYIPVNESLKNFTKSSNGFSPGPRRQKVNLRVRVFLSVSSLLGIPMFSTKNPGLLILRKTLILCFSSADQDWLVHESDFSKVPTRVLQ